MRIIKYSRDVFSDAVSYDDMRRKIRLFLDSIGHTYPGFDKWVDKVFSEAEESDRRVILLCVDDCLDIMGLTILKNAPDEKKICTIRVSERHMRQKLGTLLMRRSFALLGDEKPLITVSEDYIDIFRPFLKKLGFVIKDKVRDIYELGKYEYFFNHPCLHRNALMSIKPIYANAIMDGVKTVEFRKKVFTPTVENVYVYSSSPEKRMVGSFSVKGIVEDTPDGLWSRYSDCGGIGKEDFDAYFSGCEKGYAIEVGDVRRLDVPVDPRGIYEGFVAPQSFCYIDNIGFLNCVSK